MAFKALEDAIAEIRRAMVAREAYRGAKVPAFYVNGTGTIAQTGTTGASDLLALTVVQMNNGSHYSTATSRFTAPVAGVYLFSVQLVTTTTTAGPQADLWKNGALLYSSIAMGYGNSYHSFSGTVMAYLQAGDYVQVYWNNNNNTSVTLDRARCTFAGHLVN